MALRYGRVRLLRQPDLRLDEAAIVRIESPHHALDARLERRAPPHADHVAHRTQEMGRAPASQHGDAPALDELERLVGGIYREAGPVGRHPLPDARLAFEEAYDVALAKPHLVREHADDLVMDELFAEALGYAGRDILAEGPHFTRHSDQRHSISTSVSGFF